MDYKSEDNNSSCFARGPWPPVRVVVPLAVGSISWKAGGECVPTETSMSSFQLLPKCQGKVIDSLGEPLSSWMNDGHFLAGGYISAPVFIMN